MSQLGRLIPQLRVPVRPRYRRVPNPEGLYGRLKVLRGVVTALVRDERIEHRLDRLDEARGYAERLIQDAIRLGDKHPSTMDMANFWLEEKQLIHKLFKVLAPRYADHNTSFTSLYRLPLVLPDKSTAAPKGVLELKGNPFPPLKPDSRSNRNLLHNILMDEARKQYRHKKYQQLAAEARAELSASSTQEPSGGGVGETSSDLPPESAAAAIADTSVPEASPAKQTPKQ